MKKVYTNQNILTVRYLLRVLENNGIQCTIKNENLQSMAGAIIVHTWPEIWLLNNDDSKRAAEIINAFENDSDDHAEPWKCMFCGENIEGNFNICWKCGKTKNV